jgi:hypothetical protein
MEEMKVLVNQEIGFINFNFDELKEKAEEISSYYAGIVVTEDTIKLAKDDMAKLRKLITELETERKKIKSAYNKPLDEFEKKVKEIVSIINKPIAELDAQYKEFEEKRKADKKLEIEIAYEELIGDMGEYAPLNSFYEARWENAGTSMKSIKEAIESVVNSAALAVGTIKGMKSDAKDQALTIYKNTLNLANAIAYINDYETKKAEILARQLEAEEQKKLAEAKKLAEEEEKARQEALAKVEVKAPSPDELFMEPEEDFKGFEVNKPVTEPVRAWQTIEVYGTSNDFEIVKQLLHSNGFAYRVK